MSTKSKHDGASKAGRTLIKAFTFAGAILGVGAFGLAKAAILLALELNWIDRPPPLGAIPWWILGGALCGMVPGALLIAAAKRRNSTHCRNPNPSSHE